MLQEMLKLGEEVEAERLTRLDRTLIDRAEDGVGFQPQAAERSGQEAQLLHPIELHAIDPGAGAI